MRRKINCLFLFAYVNLLSAAAAVHFTIEPLSVVTGDEEPAPLVCAVEGLNYKISWREKNGKPLEESRRREAQVTNWHYEGVTGSNIFIKVWSKQKTKFTCVVSDLQTGKEVATRSAFLSRDRNLQLGEEKRENRKGYVGQGFPMDCELDGINYTHVYWFKRSSNSEERSYVYTPGEEAASKELTVYPKDTNDMAHYTCFYLNENGELQKGKRVWLGGLRLSSGQSSRPPMRPPRTTAYSPPIRTLVPTASTLRSMTTTTTKAAPRYSAVEITSKYIDDKSSSDKERRLICEASGFPRPDVFWLRNNNKSKSLGRQTTHENDKFNARSTLIISPLSRPENFTCVANQEGKEVKAVLEVRPKILPAPRITSKPMLDKKREIVLIEWERVPSVERYVLYVTINKTEPALPFVINKSKSSYEFHVEKFTKYSAYLTAEDVHERNSFGSSPFDFTGPLRPSDVTQLSVVLTDSGKNAKLSWTPVNVPEVKYNVYYTYIAPPSPDLMHWSNEYDVTEAFHEFDNLNLSPGDKYTFLGKDVF